MIKLDSDFDRTWSVPGGGDFLLIFFITGGALYADFVVDFVSNRAPFSMILLIFSSGWAGFSRGLTSIFEYSVWFEVPCLKSKPFDLRDVLGPWCFSGFLLEF